MTLPSSLEYRRLPLQPLCDIVGECGLDMGKPKHPVGTHEELRFVRILCISFLQFLPIIRQLVLLAYTNPDGIGHSIGDSDNHWIQIGWSSDDPGALPIYLNKVTMIRAR